MSGKTSIAVLGGGSWGTALAHLLAHAGHSVALLLRDTEQAAHINAHHENPRYLRGVQLHPGIRAVAGDTGGPEQAEVLAGISILVLSVPCQAMRGTLRRLAGVVPPDCVLVNTAKGIEVSELVTVERMVREELPGFVDRYAVLSGPSFALEVATCKPTAVVLGCRDERLGARLREVFSAPWFRAYSSSDVPGVELGGAVKNVIALAVGIAMGLDYGDNAKAALITRGNAELARLGVAMGCKAETFAGLSGMGDLIVTCTSMHSRNRRAGILIGKGYTMDEAMKEVKMVVEGVYSARAARALSKKYQVSMPIVEQVNEVLFDGKPAKDALYDLMLRDRRAENALLEWKE